MVTSTLSARDASPSLTGTVECSSSRSGGPSLVKFLTGLYETPPLTPRDQGAPKGAFCFGYRRGQRTTQITNHQQLLLWEACFPNQSWNPHSRGSKGNQPPLYMRAKPDRSPSQGGPCDPSASQEADRQEMAQEVGEGKLFLGFGFWTSGGDAEADFLVLNV